MTDRYAEITRLPVAGQLVKNLGLPQPIELDRWRPGSKVVDGPLLFGAAPGGRLSPAVAKALESIGADVHSTLNGDVRGGLANVGLDAKVFNPEAPPAEQRFKALVFDATGIKASEQLRELREFFGATIRRVLPSGRVVVLGTPPEATGDPREATAQRALEGFTRSVAKEVKKGAAAQLVYVTPGGEAHVESTLRFLLSPKSAYVSGQVVRVAKAPVNPKVDWDQPLNGKLAVVTGASRGIGAAIAEVLARDGAKVLGIDIPPVLDELIAVTDRLGGSALALDVTSPDAPTELADHIDAEHGGLDIVVHNAGITRDKTLGRMTDELWDQVIDVNLTSQERINAELIQRDIIRPQGRIICVSSLSGIAGNAGQTNYATSKAGVAGMVVADAPILAKKKITINAVAPGFIETQMTAAMPFAIREAGRRMNSMSQGGLPVDVAETIAWFASPGSAGVNGNVVRVCGQSLLGVMRTLESSPGMLGLYARAGLGSLPLVGGRSGGDVPDLELALPGIEIDRGHVAKYARVCGFGVRDELPPTYPHILAFPLQMAMMTDSSFPFPAIGMVHLTNRIVQHRPVRASDVLDLRVGVAEGPEHHAGRLVRFTTEARAGDELVWESVSGYLRRGGGSGSRPERSERVDPPTEAIWRVPGDTGRRYAEVSGDRNPIHMHDLTAKLFGFKKAIAHGMWTKARALAALEGRLPAAFTVDVGFEKPLFLPAKVEFATDETHFAVRSSSAVHLRGELS